VILGREQTAAPSGLWRFRRTGSRSLSFPHPGNESCRRLLGYRLLRWEGMWKRSAPRGTCCPKISTLRSDDCQMLISKD
jgi:hypothetical protein